MPDTNQEARSTLLSICVQIEALHQSRKERTYRGLNPDWDGTSTANLDEAMVLHVETVCTAGCGAWPCDTLKVVRRG